MTTPTDASTDLPASSSMKAHLLELSDYAWQRLRHRLGGLTDEEYLWEPVPGVWTVRPTGDGGHAADGSALPPQPAPFTTLAWRIAHIAGLLGEDRTATWLGLPVGADQEPAPQGTAAAAIAAIERAHAIWRRRLAAVTDEALARPMGEIAGPFAESDGAAFVLHILDELIHHGAEIGVVRDLYAHQRPQDPFADACLRGDRAEAERLSAQDPGVVERLRQEDPGIVSRAASRQRWDAVRLLVDLGFGVDAPERSSAPSPLHYAAGAGALDVARLLVERGADLDRVDTAHQATPLGWAEHFGHAETVAYLRSVRR
ncbi:ankyrin repeat domain-containing protein [Actinopolymorpha sp. NPDC004070]|uniref:ankyrin repeat domain-containing protein n=1 Tax=Actinopolymorpha sp. NPDC004070 TaxID=3154548 RepID=UPI0033AE23F1